jgi:hypothetical protein
MTPTTRGTKRGSPGPSRRLRVAVRFRQSPHHSPTWGLRLGRCVARPNQSRGRTERLASSSAIAIGIKARACRGRVGKALAGASQPTGVSVLGDSEIARPHRSFPQASFVQLGPSLCGPVPLLGALLWPHALRTQWGAASAVVAFVLRSAGARCGFASQRWGGKNKAQGRKKSKSGPQRSFDAPHGSRSRCLSVSLYRG